MLPLFPFPTSPFPTPPIPPPSYPHISQPFFVSTPLNRKTFPPLSLTKKTRQASKLLLLPQLHLAHLPPPDGAGPEDRRPHGPAQGERRLPRQGGDFRKGSPGVAEGDCADVSGTAGVRVVWDLEVWGWGVRREGGG